MHLTPVWLCTLTILSNLCAAFRAPQALPRVDLGYEIHQAASYNSTGKYLNFTNIRYAAPPTGQRRFKAPVPPFMNRSKVHTGEGRASCPQGLQDYLTVTLQFMNQYLTTGTWNTSTFNLSAPIPYGPPPGPISEDCLFLDVLVPDNVFKRTHHNKLGAPVLVWIHGGSYTFGTKNYWGNPAGLLERSRKTTEDGVIFVPINYRLGAFGFLSDPLSRSDVTANAGLHDQRMALDWVQKYIHLFGGDPKQVTIMSESAGAGSTYLQYTAFGGRKIAPFKGAIIQSPAWDPVPHPGAQVDNFRQFLAAANVSTITQARQLPSDVLIRANEAVIKPSLHGTIKFGPVVDGDFIPEVPGVLLHQGKYDKNVELIVGHTSDEGIGMASPYVKNQRDFKAYLDEFLQKYPKASIDHIAEKLYPPVYDGSQGYTSQIRRTARMMEDSKVICNSHALHNSQQNRSHGYVFSIFPGAHGQDIPYTFYNGYNPVEVPFVDVAVKMQGSWLRFAERGAKGLDMWPEYGPDNTVLSFNVTITTAKDKIMKERCAYWNQGLFAQDTYGLHTKEEN